MYCLPNMNEIWSWVRRGPGPGHIPTGPGPGPQDPDQGQGQDQDQDTEQDFCRHIISYLYHIMISA